MLTPTDAVLSDNNKKGAVTLNLDDIEDGSTRKLANYIPKSLTSTKGDMIYASDANTPARLAIGSNGQFLSIANGVPKWVNNPNTDTHYTNYLQIKGNGTEAVKFEQNANKTLNLKPGTNISISAASGEITISATDTNTHNSHIVYSGKKSDGTTDISSGTASSGNITLGDSGASAGSYGNASNQEPGYGKTFNVPYITVNAKGIVTAISNKTVKIPASDNTNTATAADNILHGSNNGTQITYAPYATQQSKLSFDTSTTAPTRTDRLNLNGSLYATKFNVAGKAAVQYNSTEDCIEFIFA